MPCPEDLGSLLRVTKTSKGAEPVDPGTAVLEFVTDRTTITHIDREPADEGHVVDWPTTAGNRAAQRTEVTRTGRDTLDNDAASLTEFALLGTSARTTITKVDREPPDESGAFAWPGLV